MGVCARRDAQCAVASCMGRSLGVPGCSAAGANNRLLTAVVRAHAPKLWGKRISPNHAI